MPRKGSLKKNFLAAIALLFLVTTGAAVGVFFLTVRSVAEEYVDRFAVSQNLLERNRILAVVERDAALSLKLADDALIHAWMVDEENPQYRQRAMTQLESYRTLFRDNAFFVGIASSLSYYVHTPETGGVNRVVLDREAPHDRWFFETLQSDRDFWINVDFNVFLNEIRVWINTLVRTDDGNLLGATGTGMDLSEFLATLVEHDEPGITTIIVNDRGQVLAHPDRSIIEHNANVEHNDQRIDLSALLESPDDRDAVYRVLRSLESSRVDTVRTLELSVGDEIVTAAVGYIPDLQWFNLVLVDGRLIMGLDSFIPLMQVIVFSLLIVLVVVIFLLNRLVLGPLERLSDAADRVAAGEYTLDLDTGPDNEIGRLGVSFTGMAERIRVHTTSLEEKVADRTREVKQSRDRLMESIRYGRLIQRSIMPSELELRKHLSEGFILERPLETVGGDFAFFRAMEDGFCIAVVDCTGHGVPGAFMTMLVSTVMNSVFETIGRQAGPAEMLRQTHQYVQDCLRASAETEHLDNGMDIALCRYRGAEKVLEFAGAGLPLMFCRDGEIERIEGTRVRLGFLSTERAPEIAQHSFPMTGVSCCYLFSDGVLDLPGGRNEYGLGTRGLRRILQSACGVSSEKKHDLIENELERYRGTASARDDMIILGFAPYAAQNAGEPGVA